MCKARVATLTAIGVSVALAGPASAQSFGIYVGPPPVEEYYYYDSAPPGYVYAPSIERRYYRAPAGHCGTYRYWNGDRCVDARSR
jgi:hypothetical protein